MTWLIRITWLATVLKYNKNTFLQSVTKIIETNAKNGVVPLSHKQFKTLLREHMVKLKIISLYI